MNYIKSIKNKIDESKYGGLIYIALFFVTFTLCKGLIHGFIYTEKLDNYEVYDMDKKSHRDKEGSVYYDYEVHVKFKLNDGEVFGVIENPAGIGDKTYENIHFGQGSERKKACETLQEIMGDLYYNKSDPEKLSTYRFISINGIKQGFGIGLLATLIIFICYIIYKIVQWGEKRK